jgi:hypothetical protein
MRPIKVTSPVAPSKAMIHQVKTKRPIPHNNPQVSAKAFTLSFMIFPLSFLVNVLLWLVNDMRDACYVDFNHFQNPPAVLVK